MSLDVSGSSRFSTGFVGRSTLVRLYSLISKLLIIILIKTLSVKEKMKECGSSRRLLVTPDGMESGLCHDAVALLGGMQMVAAVIGREKSHRVLRIFQGMGEIHTAVNLISGADPVVDGTAQFFPEGCKGTPATDGQQGSHVNVQPQLSGFPDIIP